MKVRRHSISVPGMKPSSIDLRPESIEFAPGDSIHVMGELSETEYPGLPDGTELSTALERGVRGSVRIVEREPNWNAHGSPGEVVKCRTADGRCVSLLCKYESEVGGEWGDVAYEARVYRDILQPLNAG